MRGRRLASLQEGKVEDGQDYPASAFLIVPNPQDPATWLGRLWESRTLQLTRAQLGRVAALLGPGFRERLTLSEGDRAGALRKLRTLYKGLTEAAGGAELPPGLQQGLYAAAVERLQQTTQRLLRGPLDAAGRAELAEDLEILRENLYLNGLSAIHEGRLSFETVCQSVQAGLTEYVRGEQSPRDIAVESARLVATFPGTCIYEQTGKLYQVDYRLEGTVALVTGERHEVVFEPRAAGPPQAQQEGRTDLVEARPAGVLRAARLNRPERVIEGTVLITAESSNGAQGKRRYTERALRQVAQLAEGLPAYANHVPRDQAFKPRDVRELIGRHRNVRYDAHVPRVVSDLHVVEHHAPWVFALAEDLGDVVGNSLVSRGVVKMEGDTEVVEEIVALRSADLVSDPAATRGLFEHREAFGRRLTLAPLLEAQAGGMQVQSLIFPKRHWDSAAAAKGWAKEHGFDTGVDETGSSYRLRQAEPGRFSRMRTICLTPKGASPEACRVQAVVGMPKSTQEGRMDIGEMLTHLKDTPKDLATLAEHFGLVAKGEHAAVAAALAEEKQARAAESAAKDKALAETKAALDASAKTLTEANTKVEKFEAAEALGKKTRRLEEAIAAHDLGKRYGKVSGVISERFKALLLQEDEAKWAALLDDQLAALTSVAGTSGGKGPVSTLKEGRTDGQLADGLHARLAAAL